MLVIRRGGIDKDDFLAVFRPGFGAVEQHAEAVERVCRLASRIRGVEGRSQRIELQGPFSVGRRQTVVAGFFLRINIHQVAGACADIHAGVGAVVVGEGVGRNQPGERVRREQDPGFHALEKNTGRVRIRGSAVAKFRF